MPAPSTPAASTDFANLCASCHGADRLGGTGPALLPENLGRLDKAEATRTIANGRPSSQMAGFAQQLSADRIRSLVDLIYTPLATVPRWGMDEIQRTHAVLSAVADPGARPVHTADPLNLFVVVELGDHHAMVLDGDKLEPVARIPTRFALHGGPKFSPDGRFVYFASRDGWVSKLDLYTLQMCCEIRAGINTRNLAVSGDGRTVLVGNYLPHSLVVLDAATLRARAVLEVAGKDGKTSRVSAVYAAPPRHTFVAAVKDLREVWEVAVDTDAAKLVGTTWTSPAAGVGVRTIATETYLDDFFFDQSYRYLIGAARDGERGRVLDLDTGSVVARLELPGMPHLASGITWERAGGTVLATPNLGEGVVSVIDMQSWQVVRRIETLGPGFFMRSHENTRYAWVDVFFGPNRDAVHVIDKETLEIVKTLRPAPGKTAAHVEFTRDGRFALLSIWEDDGAIVVFDAVTLEEVKRIPARKPSGKYNVYNKITRSAGTSH